MGEHDIGIGQTAGAGAKGAKRNWRRALQGFVLAIAMAAVGAPEPAVAQWEGAAGFAAGALLGAAIGSHGGGYGYRYRYRGPSVRHYGGRRYARSHVVRRHYVARPRHVSHHYAARPHSVHVASHHGGAQRHSASGGASSGPGLASYH